MRKLLAALFCCLLIFAGAFAEDSDWTYTQSGTAAYITGYTGTETIATIPTSINGVKILGAVPGAFADTTLKDVRLDEFAASGRFTVKGDSEYGIYGPCTAKYYLDQVGVSMTTESRSRDPKQLTNYHKLVVRQMVDLNRKLKEITQEGC